ncbi:MAG: hypothetical protein QME55_02115, partial [Brevundimonas sp.]|uniref:hypothetical protein n=1 Tax=Brevundimonas sp. TaxID=1871086 RepID=UPI002610C780
MISTGRPSASAASTAAGDHGGGDGLVAARTLADWGFPVRVLALADEMERAEGLPGLQWRRLGGWPVERR